MENSTKSGISEAELERINPNMKTVLNEGDIIWVPANKIDSGEYTMYAVQQGEGFFALKRKSMLLKSS